MSFAVRLNASIEAGVNRNELLTEISVGYSNACIRFRGQEFAGLTLEPETGVKKQWKLQLNAEVPC